MFNTDYDVGSESGRVRFQLDRLVALSYLTFSEAGLKGFKCLAPEIIPAVGARLERCGKTVPVELQKLVSFVVK